jgi:hypothetical protein
LELFGKVGDGMMVLGIDAALLEAYRQQLAGGEPDDPDTMTKEETDAD